MKYPKLIVFDLDDTLLDFDGSVDQCWRMAYNAFSGEMPGITSEVFRNAIKDYAGWFWSDPERHRSGRLDLPRTRCEIVCESLRRIGVDDVVLGYKMGEYYTREREKAHVLFPDALEVLDSLKAKSICLAMITNGRADLQRHKIERFNLQPYFEHILIEGEFGVGKPDERVYRHVLDAVCAEPSESWMVGDNLEWDVFAPMRLGITGVWFNNRDRQLPGGSNIQPDRTIQTLRELM